jgi:hypothetical protein
VRLSRFPIARRTVLQALQVQEVSVRRILPGGTGISRYRPNQGFVKRKFNIGNRSFSTCARLWLQSFLYGVSMSSSYRR